MFNSSMYNSSTYNGGYTLSVNLRGIWNYYASIDHLTVMQQFLYTSIAFATGIKRVVRIYIYKSVSIMSDLVKTPMKFFVSSFNQSTGYLHKFVLRSIRSAVASTAKVTRANRMFKVLSTAVSFISRLLSSGYIYPKIIGSLKRDGQLPGRTKTTGFLIGNTNDTGFLKGRMKRK